MTSRAGPDGLWLPVPDVAVLHEGTSPMRCIRRVRAAPRTGFPFDVEASTLGTYIRLAGVDEHGGPIAWMLLRPSMLVVVAPLSAWGLDLTDATGRAHARRWLFRRSSPSHLRPQGGVVFRWDVYHGLWFIQDARYRVSFGATGGEDGPDCKDGGQMVGGVVVPSLAGLTPNSASLLPDGSRWFYAEALRRVCLHHMRRAE